MLSRWLGRARRRPFAARNLARAALELHAIPCHGDDCPLAALACLGDTGQAAPASCLRLDPVHLRADTRGLLLFDAGTFPFEADESRALAVTLADWLAQDGWQLLQGERRRWYLLGEQDAGLQSPDLPGLRGRPLRGDLLRGEQATVWQQRINELQMLMYNHPVNRQRAQQRQPLVNGLWAWGGGRLPAQVPETPFTRLFSDDAVVRGIGRLAGIPCEPVPATAQAVLEHAGEGHLLLTLESLDGAAAYQDLQRWNQALEACERDWFAPLLNALASGQLQHLNLLPLNGQAFHMRPVQRWQFWKPRRSVRHTLGHGRHGSHGKST